MNLVWPGHQSYSDLIYQQEDIHLNINKNWQKVGGGSGLDGQRQHTRTPPLNTPIDGWPAGHMAPIFNMQNEDCDKENMDMDSEGGCKVGQPVILWETRGCNWPIGDADQ